ncbi:YicC/YloC family endoribonuclease [Metabacillus fastidiosus]|uniref:YicC/YloC family endoribonuclease n=1 Tax=Metabacillus fastidiosus TaxID=1458 RepID=UPI002DB8C126|nr:YicC/YloC family endoribonuclease [Metabacillus fastidiosus]MEC2074642.1 YicC family protein [Metabacillus fastidiosus]
MVASMTGFGRAVGEVEGLTVTVEMKSVNHRFSEISVRMSRQFLTIEDKIKKVISKSLHRGRIEVFISVEGDSLTDRTVRVDWSLLDQYMKALTDVKEKYSLSDTIKMDHLLKNEDVIHVEESANHSEHVEEKIIQVVKNATEQLVIMRNAEGEQLGKDLNIRLKQLLEHTEQLEQYAPSVVKHYHDKVHKRLQEFVSGAIDENRLIQEAAIFADKVDISEELIRIRSHIRQFSEALLQKGAVGRKLDFLVQELNREANTIGSKANDSEIAKIVVELKSIIEKLKEQVQNIE